MESMDYMMPLVWLMATLAAAATVYAWRQGLRRHLVGRLASLFGVGALAATLSA
jgi:hypothetical protein